MQCPNCGSEIPEGKAFCGNCGHRLAPPGPTGAQPTTAPPTPPPPSRAPVAARPAPRPESREATVLTTEVLVSKVDATRIVKRGFEGGVFKRERLEEHAPKIHLPLWRVHCKIPKGLFGRQKADEYLYYSAQNGKLLTLDRKELRFTNIVEVKAHRVTDLDGTARFVRRPLSQLTSEPITPKVSKEAITEKARDMFGVQAVGAELLLFPVWQFTVVHKKTGAKRQVLIDTTFGRLVS